MRRLHHRDQLSLYSTSSLLPGALCVAILFLTRPASSLVLPQLHNPTSESAAPSLLFLQKRDEEAIITGPGLLNDLTLPLGAGIGCIVGVYAGTLVLVGLLIAILLPTRRRALVNGIEEVKAQAATKLVQAAAAAAAASDAKSPALCSNLPYPSPRHFVFPPEPPQAYINKEVQVHEIPAYEGYLSQSSICLTPISDPLASQKEVMENRQEAHEQLADLYKLVLQQDDERHSPQGSSNVSPIETAQLFPQSEAPKETPLLKRIRQKPASLSLDKQDVEKRKSRGSALLSAILSPRRKNKGLSISSPLMTPTSAHAPYHDPHEMLTLSPRHYIPQPPPQVPISAVGSTPEQSPPASPRGTIDERLNRQLALRESKSSLRHADTQNGDDEETHEKEEEDEEQDDSFESRMRTPRPRAELTLLTSPTSPGLPLSPRSTRFSGLPQSPKPGATFQNQVPTFPTAVRQNGALALRAYEPAGGVPLSPQFKQTTFERTGMLSPGSPGAVPYTPYQPFTPCFPMSPTLVTKSDRKRMKRLEPKTPTVELVQSNEDIW